MDDAKNPAYNLEVGELLRWVQRLGLQRTRMRSAIPNLEREGRCRSLFEERRRAKRCVIANVRERLRHFREEETAWTSKSPISRHDVVPDDGRWPAEAARIRGQEAPGAGPGLQGTNRATVGRLRQFARWISQGLRATRGSYAAALSAGGLETLQRDPGAATRIALHVCIMFFYWRY